jgi:hypothetical protein
MTEKITEETTLAEVLSHPRAERILSKYNLPCLHCPAAAFEMKFLKIGEVAKTYGINADMLLNDLNKQITAKN